MKTRMAILVAMLAAGSSGAYAEQRELRGGISVRADKIEQVSDESLRFRGNVEVVGATFRIHADSVDVQQSGSAKAPDLSILATHHVIFSRGSDRLSCGILDFNPTTGSGVFHLFSQGADRPEGDEAAQQGDEADER